jgi:hypothetical protein
LTSTEHLPSLCPCIQSTHPPDRHTQIHGTTLLHEDTPQVHTTRPSALLQAPQQGVAEDRLWLLPLLSAHGAYAPCRIGWFTSVVLPAIRACDEAAATAHAGGFGRNARVLVTRASQLWRLLPAVLRAPVDVATGAFDAVLGRALSGALSNPARPDLAELVSKGLVLLISGLRASAGLPAVSLEQYRRLSGDEDDENDGDLAESRSVVGGGRGGDDGATVFGRGGVSVYGGSVSSTDPRHHWLVQALHAPPLSAVGTAQNAAASGVDADSSAAAATRAAAAAGLSAVSSLARNYLPVLFNTFEVAVVAASQPIVQPAPPAPGVAVAPLPPVTGAALLSRVQHVLEATTLYLSVAPQVCSGGSLVSFLNLSQLSSRPSDLCRSLSVLWAVNL